MRITGGIYNSRVIKMPKGIRPTQDKVRQALFNILGPRVEGANFLELFAGSGAVGLEAASRGAASITFVEDTRECARVIYENIKALGVEMPFKLLQTEAVRTIEALSGKERFDIIFLDPPYHKGLSEKALMAIDKSDIMSVSGIIIAEHFKKEILPKSAGNLKQIEQKAYGDTVLSFYRRKE